MECSRTERENIRSEKGAEVIKIKGNYDYAIKSSLEFCSSDPTKKSTYSRFFIHRL